MSEGTQPHLIESPHCVSFCLSSSALKSLYYKVGHVGDVDDE